MRATSPSRQFSDLQHQALKALKGLAIDKPVFPLEIGWARSYDELLGHQLDVQPESSVIDRLLTVGRVILSGRGGGGKTQLLRRVARKANEEGILPVIIDLTGWSSKDYDAWHEWSRTQGGSAAFLLNRFSQPAVTPKELAWLPPSRRKLILIDGLNELTEAIGLQIVESVDRFAQSQILTSVLITDRLVRRALPMPSRFALGLVMPLAVDVIRKYVKDEVLSNDSAGLLDLPFFLNAALREGGLRGKRSAVHEQFFNKHAGLSNHELDRVACAAYQAYEVNKARTFDLDVFSESAGGQLAKRLIDAGIIVRRNSHAFFSHHLKHDYLAARHVSRLDLSDWTPSVLDTLSFRKSSFDAIALVFEQLSVPRAEAFLRLVYDWNLYAAGYALGEGISSGLDLPREMQAVILAMLAEKRFDIVVGTSQRAADAINLVSSSVAIPFQEARSLPEVFDAVNALPSNEPWFIAWRNLFTRPANYRATDEDLHSLQQQDSITGWTMANVLRRVLVTPPHLAALRTALASDVPVVRWRIAHVLGAFPSAENVEMLLRLLDTDSDDNVRYGAIRSLIEEAVRGTPDLRHTVEKHIIERIPTLMKTELLLGELARVLIVIEAPESWGLTVVHIGKEIFRRAPDTEQIDRWRSYLANANRRYGLLD